MVPSSVRAMIRRRLLAWYDRNRRDLPWRHRAGDPYAQWVAEIMLQQTRVQSVLDYYERFLRRFPTVDALAQADHQDVLKHWEGLGYYRRAMQLHRAAREVHAGGGRIPDTAEGLRRLPGVGDYTAAAVASIAFGRREPAVDGNAARIIARLFGVSEDILSVNGKARVRDLAARLMPRKRPGDFNQAWMDLGSMVCTPRSPKCTACPVASACVAAATDRTTTLPVREGHRRIVEVVFVVGVFVHRGRMLARRRPMGRLWSGLWEFPNEQASESPSGESRRAAMKDSLSRHQAVRSARRGPSHSWIVRRLAKTEGLSILASPRPAATVRHRLTHRSLTFHVYLSRVDRNGSMPKDPSRRWVTHRGFRRLSVSTAYRRIFAAVQDAVSRSSKVSCPRHP